MKFFSRYQSSFLFIYGKWSAVYVESSTLTAVNTSLSKGFQLKTAGRNVAYKQVFLLNMQALKLVAGLFLTCV